MKQYAWSREQVVHGLTCGSLSSGLVVGMDALCTQETPGVSELDEARH